MREKLEVFGKVIREGFASFKSSMIALMDDKSTKEDMTALMWIAAIALVIVVIAWLLRAHEKRTIM